MSCSSGPKIITEGLVFNLDPSNSKSYPAINDPYRNDVSLLLDFDEGFIDKSKNNTSFTTTGSPSITTNSKYGSGAGSFNGSNSYIEPSLNTTTSFGTGDFTIEFWFYTNWCIIYKKHTFLRRCKKWQFFQFTSQIAE